MLRQTSLILILGFSFVLSGCFSKTNEPVEMVEPTLGPPFRTFITIQKYYIEQNGDPSEPISNVKLEILFPNGKTLDMPEGQYWPIGNGQAQEIGRTFELPWTHVRGNGFKFNIQIVRKGSLYKPCKFEVAELSDFNRAYICHTDLPSQERKNLPEELWDKEGVQVRVFTDLNTPPKEIPADAIAIR